MSIETKISGILFLSVILAGLLGTIGHDNFFYLSSIPVSNTNFTRSIVLNHRLNLDNYTQSSGIDIVHYQGHYYPAYPPGYSFMAVPFYAALQVFNYLVVHTVGPMNGTLSIFLESFFLALPSILSLAGISVLVYRYLRLLEVSNFISGLAGWAVPFTTFLLGYLSAAFFHLPAAFFLLLGFYLLTTRDKFSYKISSAIGLSLGLVLLTEYVPALCFIPLGLAFLFKSKDLKKSAVVFLVFCLGVLALGVYNKTLFGSFTRFGESVAATSDNKEAISVGITFDGNPLVGLFGNYLSREKGLLGSAPLFLLALPGFYFWIKKRRFDSVVALCFIVIVSGVYAFWHDWGGGWSLGPRFYTSIIPFFFIATGYFLDRAKRSRVVVAVTGVLTGVGVFTAFWSLMMGPRLQVPKVLLSPGTPAWQRFLRLPIIISEGSYNPKNVAPLLIERSHDFPLLAHLQFTTIFLTFVSLILILMVGPLVLIYVKSRLQR